MLVYHANTEEFRCCSTPVAVALPADVSTRVGSVCDDADYASPCIGSTSLTDHMHAASSAMQVMDGLHSISLADWTKLAAVEDVLPDISVEVPMWVRQRSKQTLVVQEFVPVGFDFKAPRPSKTRPPKKQAPARARAGDVQASQAQRGENSARLHIGLSHCKAEKERSGDKVQCLTYSMRVQHLSMSREMTAPQPQIGKVDIRYLQLVRDAGELLIARAFDPDAHDCLRVTVHVTTMQLLKQLQQLPRPTLPALLTLFVWGIAHCIKAVHESSTDSKIADLSKLMWHHSYAEGLSLSWKLVQVAAATTWVNSDNDVGTALSVLACIPRAALIGSEQFDKTSWATILERSRTRQGHRAPLDEVRAVKIHHP